MSENELVIQGKAFSAIQVREQVNLIQTIMKEVMQEGQHYGKIPGCGDKPTLLKPGAEKLSLTFRLRPIIDNDRDIRVEKLENGHREISVYCHVINSDGVELATGVGSCSTMESKYRYRGGEKIATGQPVPKEYWNLKKEGKYTESQESIGGKGFGVAKIDGVWQIVELGEKMENPDIADTYNTVLKMAKKRAYVDGILSATAASDIFTQDIEDMAVEAVSTAIPANVKPEVKTPQPMSAQPKIYQGKAETATSTLKPPAAKPEDDMKKMLADFEKAKGILGEHGFYQVLGAFGIESVDEIQNIKFGMQVLNEMKRACKNKNE